MNSIKNIILTCAAIGLVSGCGSNNSNLAEQIEGVKWQAGNGKEMAFLRFIGGEMQVCDWDETRSQWKTVVSYTISGETLTGIITENGQKTERDVDISISGKDNGRVLTVSSSEGDQQKYAISTTQELCPT